MVRRWPLIGRDSELAACREALGANEIAGPMRRWGDTVRVARWQHHAGGVRAGVGAAGLLGRLDEALELRERGLAAIGPHPERTPWAHAQAEYGACGAAWWQAVDAKHD